MVADKPFAPNAAEGQELVDAAEAARVPLAVFHNRRWDTDLRTPRCPRRGGELGSVRRVESRFDLDSPETIDPGPNGGVLRDLGGAHLADQLLWLLGPVTQVYAALDWIEMPEGGRTDTGFTVTMRHLAGPVSTMVAGKANHARGRELRVYAEAGSYRSTMGDVQTEAILAGRRPVLEGDRWGGYADEAEWGGTLSTAGGVDRVPSSRGGVPGFLQRVCPGRRRGRVISR